MQLFIFDILRIRKEKGQLSVPAIERPQIDHNGSKLIRHALQRCHDLRIIFWTSSLLSCLLQKRFYISIPICSWKKRYGYFIEHSLSQNLFNSYKIAHIQIVRIPRMKFNHKNFFGPIVMSKSSFHFPFCVIGLIRLVRVKCLVWPVSNWFQLFGCIHQKSWKWLYLKPE